MDLIIAGKMGDIFRVTGEPGKLVKTRLATGSNNVESCVFSLKLVGDYAITGTGKGTLKIWHRTAEPWKMLKVIELPSNHKWHFLDAYAMDIDDTYLYIGVDPCTVEVRDPRSDLQVLHRLEGFKDRIIGITASGGYIFIFDDSGTLYVYNKQLEQLSSAYQSSWQSNPPRSNMISVDGNQICISNRCGFAIYKWDGTTLLRPLWYWNDDDCVVTVQMIGDVVYWVSWRGWLREFSLGRKVKLGRKNKIGNISFMSIHVDNEYIYAGDYSGLLRIFDRKNARLVGEIYVATEIQVITPNIALFA